MQKLLLAFLLLVLYHACLAQVAVRSGSVLMNEGSFGGTPIMRVYPAANQQNVDIKSGSLFFNEQWLKATIVTAAGGVHADVPVRINLLKQAIHLKDAAGKEQVASTPLSEIIFDTPDGGARIHFINGKLLPAAKEGWYQLLVNNEVTLVKSFKKFLEIQNAYGGGRQYHVTTSENYLVLYKSKLYELKKPMDFVQVLPDKKSAIQTGAKNISSRLSRDAQLTAMAQFVNTLL